jgi:gamma-glutamylcyclotransferase (GGCT)/AIG2-like uncharacterized protein YtfP
LTNRVAFYGTLLTVHGAQDHLGIRERCRFVGTCTLSGLLFDLGGYPALVEGDGRVYAEVFDIDDETLWVVDAFEGFDPDDPDAGDYVRVPTHPLDGAGEVWVYRYTGDLDDAERIESGDFRRERSAW